MAAVAAAAARRRCASASRRPRTDGPWRIAETNSMQDEAAEARLLNSSSRTRAATPPRRSPTSKTSSRSASTPSSSRRASSKGFEGLCRRRSEAKIPVFLIDRELEGLKAGDDYVTFIGSNFIEEGKRAGEWLAKQTNGEGRNSRTARHGRGFGRQRPSSRDFADAIKGFPDMKIIASQTATSRAPRGRR
jgi:hypothetical protein